MKKHTIFFPILLITIACLAQACFQTNPKEKTTQLEAIPVQIMPLELEKSEELVEATGVFTTDDETLLSFKNGGILEAIFVEEGDPVKKGQLLARVNRDEINAKAKQAALGYEKAKRDYDRALSLYKDSVATLEQMQNAKTVMELTMQDLNSMQYNQQYAEIRSNSDGYVLAKLAQQGQIVGPGMPVLQINGAEEDRWQLKVGVSERQWANIQRNDSASIQSDALGLTKHPARVSKKSAGLDPKSGTYLLYLTLTVPAQVKIATGMFGKAFIQGQGNKKPLYKIPYDALMEGDGKVGYVFISEDYKTAKRVDVSIGELKENYVQISAGLQAGNALIVTGSPYLVDGALIKVEEKKEAR